LQKAKYSIIIYIDYINFHTFIIIKILNNRRLARWTEELANYKLIIKYIKETDNAKTDTLSRKSEYNVTTWIQKHVVSRRESVKKESAPRRKLLEEDQF